MAESSLPPSWPPFSTPTVVSSLCKPSCSQPCLYALILPLPHCSNRRCSPSNDGSTKFGTMFAYSPISIALSTCFVAPPLEDLNFQGTCAAFNLHDVFFDKELRKQIIASLESLLPAYGNFIARFQDVLGKHADEYIEYGMSDIEDRFNRLFLQQ